MIIVHRKNAGSVAPEWSSRLAILPLLVLALLCGPGGVPAGARDKPKSDPARETEAEKPTLKLKVDPAVGFQPLTVTVSGLLSGVRRDDPNFCHAAVIWMLVAPGLREDDAQTVREDPACLHPADEVAVDVAFAKVYDLGRPGSYQIRLEIQGKDGTRVRSAFTQVQVLRAY